MRTKQVIQQEIEALQKELESAPEDFAKIPDTRKAERLEKRFEIKKLTNPGKQVKAIVLEFDDPIAQVAIMFWTKLMFQAGYKQVAMDTTGCLQENVDRTRLNMLVDHLNGELLKIAKWARPLLEGK